MRGDVGPARGLAAKLGRAIAQRHVVDSTGKLISHDCGWKAGFGGVGFGSVVLCVLRLEIEEGFEEGGGVRGSRAERRVQMRVVEKAEMGAVSRRRSWQSGALEKRHDRKKCVGCSTNSHKLAEM